MLLGVSLVLVYNCMNASHFLFMSENSVFLFHLTYPWVLRHKMIEVD